MSSKVLAAVALASLVGITVLANVSGAIYTTVADGSVVNANIYASKDDVYLNGGPQNDHSSGLAPDGAYYFQVTDPSGTVLLSTDDITCRVVKVTGSRIVGVPADAAGGYGNPACYHAPGTFNANNGSLSVQLMPYLDTPNNGGEYKAWLTPVEAYDTACQAGLGSHRFCNSESKTDNFKVRASAPEASHISVCKFNDQNANGVQDHGEPFMPHWPITATGVDGGTAHTQTGDSGCISFTVSDFTEATRTITLAEGAFGPDWTQTAPSSCDAVAGCSIDGGVITLTVGPGVNVDAPNFGNTNPHCTANCAGDGLVLTANAFAGLSRTFGWTIAKDADRTDIATAGSSAVFNYTVTVTHDAGTDSNWATSGTIVVANPGSTPLPGLELTAAVDNGGTCAVADGSNVTIPAGSHVTRDYGCQYADAPADGTLTVAVSGAAAAVTTNAGISFSNAAVNVIDNQATITDTLAGTLGVVTSADPSPLTFEYATTVAGVPGTCVTTNNTATYTTDTTAATGSASRAVTLCVGANLTVTNTAETAFASAITKTTDRALIEQQGGNAALSYTVRVTESGWTVSGSISVTNPNDWQGVSVSASDVIDNGGVCTVTDGGTATVPALSTLTFPYACSYAAAPSTATGINVATVAWNSAAAFTPASTAAGDAPYAFSPLTVLDTFDAETITLGTIATPAALTTYTYSRTVPNAGPGACRVYANTAAVAGRAQTASASVTVCNTLTGARTIGFWQNKNGQGIITADTATAGVCNATTWLRQFTPFQDLGATASCRTLAAYATTIIKAANASGAAMNAMLKAQMLATSLDVYFSNPALGGNKIGALTSVGGVTIDLTQVCAAINGAAGACNGVLNASPAFGGTASMTVANMLLFQSGVASAGGTLWYGNNKVVQGYAKNAFDAINNEVAFVAP